MASILEVTTRAKVCIKAKNERINMINAPTPNIWREVIIQNKGISPYDKNGDYSHIINRSLVTAAETIENKTKHQS